VTVAVLDGTVKTDDRLSQRGDDDFRVEWFSGTGKGGQHRNKHQNCCRYIHIPTGMKKEATGRSRETNQRDAREALLIELDRQIQDARSDALSTIRRDQTGTGMRGDKIRTYRFQDDVVKDSRSGRIASVEKVMRGNFDLLWP